ncbi:hypothetical protein GIB67_000185 [Kingdonia uniflora]|uniref:Uncharacterized protein n=1 Tax=Kingdonia uniflora TaxID=39325 RepID=A0A7J7P9H9_9MAGN|nr:hypothetical protein GIB67_000185 [Kingdonia uniflora]
MALHSPIPTLSLKTLFPTTTITTNIRQRRRLVVTVMKMVDIISFEEGELERPKWAGGTPLSRLVGALISFKPLYSVMKFGARQVLISTAEKTNVPWREMTREILESQVYEEMGSIQNTSLVYPDCNFGTEHYSPRFSRTAVHEFNHAILHCDDVAGIMLRLALNTSRFFRK